MDGEIQTACAQSCPARAIVFGDLEDDSSRVVPGSRGPPVPRLLEDLGTEPGVIYLRRYGRGRIGMTEPTTVATPPTGAEESAEARKEKAS